MQSTTAEPSETLVYVRKVYAWLLAGVLLSCAAAWATLSLGTPVDVTFREGVVAVPPAVEIAIDHPILSLILLVALVIASTVVRRASVASVAIYVTVTALMGAITGPSLFIAQLYARTGHTLSAHPIRDAGLLTMLVFGSLTGYVFTTRRDFTAWGGALTTGLAVILGAMFLALFLDSNAFELAISSVAIILFSGFILYDTSVILRKSDMDDPISDALNLFLDLINLFVNLLRFLSNRSD